MRRTGHNPRRTGQRDENGGEIHHGGHGVDCKLIQKTFPVFSPISTCCQTSISTPCSLTRSLPLISPFGPTFGCSSSKAPSLFGCVLRG
jgi:hypothetical protein